jgi:hypothetical protein
MIKLFEDYISDRVTQEKSELNLVRDILTDLEDEYGIGVYFNVPAITYFAVISISTSSFCNIAPHDLIRTVDRIDSMLDHKYEVQFRLVFKNKMGHSKVLRGGGKYNNSVISEDGFYFESGSIWIRYKS